MPMVLCISVILQACSREIFWHDIGVRRERRYFTYREVIVTEPRLRSEPKKRGKARRKSVIFIIRSFVRCLKNWAFPMIYTRKRQMKSTLGLWRSFTENYIPALILRSAR